MRIEVFVNTGYYPTAHAHKRLNGCGGVARGYALDKLYQYAHDLLYARKIQLLFFHPTGGCNPADELSRKFGVHTSAKVVSRKMVNDMGLPPLAHSCQPLSDDAETDHFQAVKQLYLNQGPFRLTMGPVIFPEKNYYEGAHEADVYDM